MSLSISDIDERIKNRKKLYRYKIILSILKALSLIGIIVFFIVDAIFVLPFIFLLIVFEIIYLSVVANEHILQCGIKMKYLSKQLEKTFGKVGYSYEFEEEDIMEDDLEYIDESCSIKETNFDIRRINYNSLRELNIFRVSNDISYSDYMSFKYNDVDVETCKITIAYVASNESRKISFKGQWISAKFDKSFKRQVELISKDLGYGFIKSRKLEEFETEDNDLNRDFVLYTDDENSDKIISTNTINTIKELYDLVGTAVVIVIKNDTINVGLEDYDDLFYISEEEDINEECFAEDVKKLEQIVDLVTKIKI